MGLEKSSTWMAPWKARQIVSGPNELFFLPTGRNPLDGTYQVSGDGSGAARSVWASQAWNCRSSIGPARRV